MATSTRLTSRNDIFVSHAVADQFLAALFIGFLKEAIGVPSDAIFCSSVPGHGIPLTVDFNAYMKEKIQDPKLVFILMTPSYMESPFCMMELGAAWAKSHRTMPIVVPPASFDKVTNTLGLVQAWNIQEHAGLVELRRTVVDAGIDLEKRNEQSWDIKRREWRQKLKKAIPKLKGATSVPASEYEAAIIKIDKLKEEMQDLECQLDTASETIEKLRNCKDPAAVRDIMRAASGADHLNDELGRLLKNVKEALPSAPSAVLKHIIMDHYDKAPRIDWFYESEKFQYAVERNIISNQDGNNVLWNTRKLSKLHRALIDLDFFLDSPDGKKFSKMQDDDIPVDADDWDFWEYHSIF